MPNTQLPHLWIPQDRVRVEAVVVTGGGETYIRDDPATHSRALREAFQRSLVEFAAKQDLDIATDLIVQITTAEDRPVSKERQHLRSLGFEILSLSSSEPNVAVAQIPLSELSKLSKRIDRYADSSKHYGRGNFAAIDAISPVGVGRKIEPSLAQVPTEQQQPCLITLFGGLPAEVKQRAAERIAAQLRDSGKSDVLVHSFANGAVAVSAELSAPEMTLIGEQYLLVRCIESNGDIVSESAVQADPIPTVLQVENPRCNTPVVIIDSGVNGACSLLAGLVLRTIDELPPGSAGPHLAHGTFVASRAIYGDEITSVLARRAYPWCRVIDVQVTGDDGIGNRMCQSAAKLGEVLQRVVPLLADEARVFNLSLGIAPIRAGFFSSLARLIDFLSREHRVLFVISAGNIDTPSAAPPAHFLRDESRVLFPAEALLALTVGSTARYVEHSCVSQENEIAPYSRRGPGADGALKPELATHGGNVFFTGMGWSTSPRMAVYGMGRAGTHLEYGIGTSYSAPVVAQYAARLFDAYPDATPNLVRALLCHFADPVLTPLPGTPVEAYHMCGFGEPNVENALYSTSESVSFVYNGEMSKDTYLHIPFHVPAALAQNAKGRLTIKGTVVFDPPVSLDDSANYSHCRVAGLLRKLTGAGLKDVAIGGDEDDVLHPWNPLFHFRHNFRRGYAAGEWELRLRLMTRGNLPEAFVQSLSVVIQVCDSSATTNVRDAIEVEFPGIYNPVQLRIAA
jgi:hypothetical protein